MDAEPVFSAVSRAADPGPTAAGAESRGRTGELFRPVAVFQTWTGRAVVRRPVPASATAPRGMPADRIEVPEGTGIALKRASVRRTAVLDGPSAGEYFDPWPSRPVRRRFRARWGGRVPIVPRNQAPAFPRQTAVPRRTTLLPRDPPVAVSPATPASIAVSLRGGCAPASPRPGASCPGSSFPARPAPPRGSSVRGRSRRALPAAVPPGRRGRGRRRDGVPLIAPCPPLPTAPARRRAGPAAVDR